MIGSAYIDGIDLYKSYGIFVTEGGYNGLVSYPALGPVDIISWPEEDGDEVDLSNPTLKSKEFSIAFAAHKNINTGAFIEQLSDKAYHAFDFRSIGRSYKLRFSAQQNLDIANRLESFSLQFVDDFPLEGYSYVDPFSGISGSGGYELDGRPLSDYGVLILKGSEADIQKSPVAKLNLLRAISGHSGAIYDGENVVFKSKEVRLNCLLRANTLEEFWRNYNALLFDLVRPGQRSFYSESMGLDYPCFYKSSSVSTFYPVDKIWCEFTLVLSFISFRVGADEYILATEAGEWIVLEQDNGTAIDMGE